jgi:hypothetical protein
VTPVNWSLIDSRRAELCMTHLELHVRAQILVEPDEGLGAEAVRESIDLTTLERLARTLGLDLHELLTQANTVDPADDSVLEAILHASDGALSRPQLLTALDWDPDRLEAAIGALADRLGRGGTRLEDARGLLCLTPAPSEAATEALARLAEVPERPVTAAEARMLVRIAARRDRMLYLGALGDDDRSTLQDLTRRRLVWVDGSLVRLCLELRAAWSHTEVWEPLSDRAREWHDAQAPAEAR